MKNRVLAVIAAAVLGVGLSPTRVFAQMTVRVDVPFAFTVEGKTVPAGPYDFSELSEGALKMSSVKTPATEVMLPIITRLGAVNEADSKVVFDKVESKMTLSEVWIAGQDGYLVYATKGAHTHQTVKGAKK